MLVLRSKVGVYHFKCTIFLGDSQVCETGATPKLIINSYVPALRLDAKYLGILRLNVLDFTKTYHHSYVPALRLDAKYLGILGCVWRFHLSCVPRGKTN
jgi:hypothetical protein